MEYKDNRPDENNNNFNVNSNTGDMALNYLLGIIEDCIELDCSEAENKFEELEILLKNYDAEKSLLDKLKGARMIFNELKPYKEKCNGYAEYFHKLEHTILDLQQDFSNRTWTEPRYFLFH